MGTECSTYGGREGRGREREHLGDLRLGVKIMLK